MQKMTIYQFKNTDEIYSDESGNFFKMSDDMPLKKVYHNGRIAVRDKTKYYGLIKLRKNAYKSQKEIMELPF